MSENSTQDRVSDLPDSLLLHVLSFLDIEDVVRTSVLSKRWQYIWTSVSTLSFVCTEVDYDEILKFVTRVNTALLHFQHTSIEKFKICSTSCWFTSEIDSWARFAADKKVGDLSLNFNDREGCFYDLPQSIRCSSSLTNLSLRGCALLDARGISWPSLKSLSLERVELKDNAIKDVVCGCPVLEFLEIFNCWRYNCLDIESKTLRKVVIASEEYSEASPLKILAPNLKFLHFYYGDFSCCKVQLVNVSSLLRATLNFSHPYGDDDTLVGLFKSFFNVKELDLGVDFIGCISSAMFVSDERAFTSKLSCLTCLTLSICSGKIDGPGIIGLLKCSPNLEKLVVNYSPDDSYTPPEFAEQAEEYWKLNRRIENFPLPHLKTVEFLDFADEERVDKYTLKLVKFLLKNAGHVGSITINGAKYRMTFKLRAA